MVPPSNFDDDVLRAQLVRVLFDVLQLADVGRLMLKLPALPVQLLERSYDGVGRERVRKRLLAVPREDLEVHGFVQIADANAVENRLCLGKALSRKRAISSEGCRVVGRLTGSFDASISVMI